MATIDVLVEFVVEHPEAFTEFKEMASAAPRERVAHAERIGRDIAVASLEFTDAEPSVPMFSNTVIAGRGYLARGFEAFRDPHENPDVPASSVVMRATVDESRLEELASRPNVRLWPNSPLTLLQPAVDCRPFRPAVSISDVRTALGVDAMILAGGGRGRGIGVGILDDGFNGAVYPVAGGFALPGARQPGTAPVTSHGSMCAADILVAAPEAGLFDYPFLGIPSSGGALRMFHALLDDRRRTGTPHVANNSYGFVAVPPRASMPTHEIYDLNHPLHRKVREVVASGVAVLFAAGNCGANCASGKCHPSSIGPGSSIHASNSLAEVITVAAVNTAGTRVGYSSQGPGMFEPQKPDVACFTHFFGNFGPGRPGGGTSDVFDNGTSAATPVAAGVVAAILSGAPGLTPAQVKRALIDSAGSTTWNADLGFGTLHAARSWAAAQAMLT